jgi:adenylate cyclase
MSFSVASVCIPPCGHHLLRTARTVVEDLLASGGCVWSALAVAVLLEALSQRGNTVDLEEAADAIDKLAAVSTDPDSC